MNRAKTSFGFNEPFYLSATSVGSLADGAEADSRFMRSLDRENAIMAHAGKLMDLMDMMDMMDISEPDSGNFSNVKPTARHRLTTEFTRELTDLCRKHAVAIDGGRLEPLDVNWNGPDTEKWEQYALNEDDFLVRGFWNQHARAIVR